MGYKIQHIILILILKYKSGLARWLREERYLL